MAGIDLVEFGIAGVQRFIAESATTADVGNSSAIVQSLAAVAAEAVSRELSAPDGLIFPVPTANSETGAGSDGVSSKVVFRAPAGDGPRVAGLLVDTVRGEWDRLVRACFGAPVATPGFPELWWTSVQGDDSDYAALWERLRQSVIARKRSRVFEPLVVTRTWLSEQNAGLPSVDAPQRLVRRHEKRERLSAQGWVKRTYNRQGRRMAARSTWSIASTAYRVALLRDPPDGLATGVARLQSAVAAVTGVGPGRIPVEEPVCACPGALEPLSRQLGAWVHPGVWDLNSLRSEYGAHVTPEAVALGRAAASGIADLARECAIALPTPWYAVLMQDVDRLGRALGGLDADGQRAASQALVGLAAAHRAEVADAEVPGVSVYAGGDDVLAFSPTSRALRLAKRLRELTDEYLADSGLRSVDGGPVTASGAVVFAPIGMPLQTVLTHARTTVEAAKSARGHHGEDRDALAVTALIGGGVRVRTIQPWSVDPVTLLTRLQPSPSVLSTGLAAQLELDRDELEQLAVRPGLRDVLAAEIGRLLARRGGGVVETEALMELAWHERDPGPGEREGRALFRPVPALVMARFLAQKTS